MLKLNAVESCHRVRGKPLVPDRGQRLRRPRRDAGATGHNARERDAGERLDEGAATVAAPAGSRPGVRR